MSRCVEKRATYLLSYLFVGLSTMNIYQIFTRLYGNPKHTNVPGGTYAENGCAKFNHFTAERLNRIRKFGFSHVWFTGVIEHATQTDYSAQGIAVDHPWVVKGKAGSPYAIKDYFDVDPDLAESVSDRMAEFEALLQRVHAAGLKFVLDFVPNHVARQYASDAAPQGQPDLGAEDDSEMAFSVRNNFYYCWGEPLHTDNFVVPTATGYPYLEMPAKATGNDLFNAWPGRNDWYETVKLNYGIDYVGGGTRHFEPIPDTWKKMTDILLFWVKKGVDAFRCDMAEMVPVEFWHYAMAQVKRQAPGVQFIAEVYNPQEYRSYIAHGGFDFLYDKVGLYDTLRGVICRYASASAITQAWQATDDIREHMLYFLENHDEQRIASDFFCGDAVKALPGLVVAGCMGNNPLMIYAGQELGERGMDAEGFSGKDGRTTIFDYWSPETLRKLAALPESVEEVKQSQQLNANEQRLYKTYHTVLRLRETSPALREGAFFDVMYVNYQSNSGFDPNRHYAFLRKTTDEAILAVANFSDQEICVGVKIPAHAFDYLHLSEGTFAARDLMSGCETDIVLTRDGETSVQVPANSAVLLSFCP